MVGIMPGKGGQYSNVSGPQPNRSINPLAQSFLGNAPTGGHSTGGPSNLQQITQPRAPIVAPPKRLPPPQPVAGPAQGAMSPYETSRLNRMMALLPGRSQEGLKKLPPNEQMANSQRLLSVLKGYRFDGGNYGGNR